MTCERVLNRGGQWNAFPLARASDCPVPKLQVSLISKDPSGGRESRFIPTFPQGMFRVQKIHREKSPGGLTWPGRSRKSDRHSKSVTSFPAQPAERWIAISSPCLMQAGAKRASLDTNRSLLSLIRLEVGMVPATLRALATASLSKTRLKLKQCVAPRKGGA